MTIAEHEREDDTLVQIANQIFEEAERWDVTIDNLAIQFGDQHYLTLDAMEIANLMIAVRHEIIRIVNQKVMEKLNQDRIDQLPW